MMRGPVAEMASMREPGPVLARVFTIYTLPPRPPGVSVPQPSAPGKLGTAPKRGTAEARASAKRILANGCIGGPPRRERAGALWRVPGAGDFPRSVQNGGAGRE